MPAPVPRPRRNERLDALIAELAEILGPAEDRLVAHGRDTEHPVVLVVGPPRSGTTLLTQWLAASRRFAVPTNLLARFSRTPAIGARIQALLTDPRYAFGEELFDLATQDTSGAFASAVGKTRGALAPNEFAFFWRRLLRTKEIAPLGPDGVARADFAGVRSAFAEIEAVLGHPVATKGMFLQYDLAAVAPHLPHAFLLRVRRDPVANALALLAARERYHGDRTVWYSARPAEFETLRALDPARQVAGQVVCTERAIDAGLAAIPPERSLELGYETFCADPRAAWDRLRDALQSLACDVGAWREGPARFDETSRARTASPDAPAVAAAVAEFAASRGT
jgi:hypothetical protein